MNTPYFSFVSQDAAIDYIYLSNKARGVSIMQFDNRVTACVEDNKGNKLMFRMYNVPVGAQVYVCETVRSIAHSANGNVRALVEDTRVLLLMKEYSLDDIYHSAPLAERSRGTLWTQDDAYAINS